MGYVFGHEFWNSQLGPLPITLDRLVLIGLLAALAIQWRIGRLQLCTMTGSDWTLLAMMLVLIASAATSGHAENIDGAILEVGPTGREFHLAGDPVFRCPADERYARATGRGCWPGLSCWERTSA